MHKLARNSLNQYEKKGWHDYKTNCWFILLCGSLLIYFHTCCVCVCLFCLIFCFFLYHKPTQNQLRESCKLIETAFCVFIVTKKKNGETIHRTYCRKMIKYHKKMRAISQRICIVQCWKEGKKMNNENHWDAC